jgi:bifunctional ADP-heptose synthase (sugar kinase/adenylyltransferase)
MKNKIVSLKELGEISSSLKKGGKKIVHCHGVFDLLHPGHLNTLKQQRSSVMF